jgi:hypothetical protein
VTQERPKKYEKIADFIFFIPIFLLCPISLGLVVVFVCEIIQHDAIGGVLSLWFSVNVIYFIFRDE